MAVNKVAFGNETLIDLTEDTVTPETLLNGATAHSANGKRIVGTLIGGTPVVEVSQAEYDALTDEEKAADILYIITDSYPSRELARNVGLDAITGLNATTVQAGIEILTKLIDLLSSKVRDCDTSSVKVRYANRNVDTNELLLFNGVNVNTKGYISNYLYSTIDSIVASVNTLNSNMLVIKNKTYTLTLDSTGNAQIADRTIGNTMPLALMITSGGNYHGNVAVNSHGILYAQAFDFGSDNKKATNITIGCKLYYIEM